MTNRPPKHLPIREWPVGDERMFLKAFTAADIFDDTGGIGAHLSEATRSAIFYGWRRWLGFLTSEYPRALAQEPADRITPLLVASYVEHLRVSMLPVSVATTVDRLRGAARLIAPERDWTWLRVLCRRLRSGARPRDRFGRLIPAHRTLDLGISLMGSAALLQPRGARMEQEIQFRDGLILAILSLWPIRRRSLAALTLGSHVRHLGGDRIELLLLPEDTKSHRMESWRVPSILLPSLDTYLDKVRPRFLGKRSHDSLWVGKRGNPLDAVAIYGLVRRRTENAYGQSMSPHDFRRAAATFLAMEAPELVGLTAGILQHTNPETSMRHYNLARGVSASRRHSNAMSALRLRFSCEAR